VAVAILNVLPKNPSVFPVKKDVDGKKDRT